MAIYALKKLLWLVVTLWLMATLVFFPLALAQQPAQMMIGEPINPIEYQRLLKELSLDKPIYVQYGEWIWKAVRGDLGNTYWAGEPVAKEISERLPYTASLMIIAMIFKVILTIPIGILSASKRNNFINCSLRIFQLGFMSIPIFWLGIVILGWTGTPQRYVFLTTIKTTLFSDPLTTLKTYALPGILMALAAAAVGSRMLRSAILEQTMADDAHNSPAKSTRKRTVSYALPVVSAFGMQVSLLLGTTVIVESLFNIPGLGTLLISAVNMRDTPVIMGVAIYFGLIVLGVNFLIDIFSGLIDPRIRSGAAQSNPVIQIADY